MLILWIFSVIQVSAQSIIITKTDDTIYCKKTEFKYPNWFYTTEESDKPIKIRHSEVRSIIDFPVYEIDENTKDDFTGIIHKIAKENIFGVSAKQNSSRLNFWISKIIKPDGESNYVIVLDPDEDLGCSGAKDNYVIFKFINNETLHIEDDISKIDCRGGYASMYLLDNIAFELLLHNEVKAIRIKQSENYQDYNTFFSDCIMRVLLLLNE